MIVTLTPNPSFDVLFTAERLVWEDANRIPMPRRRPGGQGINVVRAARALDPAVRARAVAPLGGAVGQELEAMLRREGTPLTAVPSPGETRVFVGVRERETDRSLLLNPRGPQVGAEVEGALLEAVLDIMDSEASDDGGSSDDRPRWLAGCGSLIPGLPADFYARLGGVARDRGWRFVPDTDGEALRLAAGAGCDLLVPNLHEAERLLERSLASPTAAAEAAGALLDLGPRMAVITLGAEGAVAATHVGSWMARLVTTPALAAEMKGASAVGAGDAFLASLLLDLDASLDPGEALCRAVAAGTAALLSTGTDLVRPADRDRVLSLVRLERAG